MQNKLFLLVWDDYNITEIHSLQLLAAIKSNPNYIFGKITGLKIIDLDSGINTSTPIPSSGAIVSGPISAPIPLRGALDHYLSNHDSPIGGPSVGHPFSIMDFDSEVLERQQRLNLQVAPSRNNIIPPSPMDPADENFIDTPSNRRPNRFIKEWNKKIKGKQVRFSIQEASGGSHFMRASYGDFIEPLTLGIQKGGIFSRIMKALDRFLSQRIIIERIKHQIKVENIKL